MKLKPYPKYKPSGVEWLGEVPADWNLLALKHVVSMQSGEQITSEAIDSAGDYPVFGGNGMRGYTSAFTHDGFYALIGRQGALCGNVNYAKDKFWASEHAVVVTPLQECSTIWLGELLRTMNLGQYSMTAAQPGLSVEAIGKLRIPLPPVSVQAAIGSYIERETAKFDTLIAKQEKLIELLQEKRQAVISHAVTKGLDPTVPMKPSSVEWLGDVPEHWEVAPLKRDIDFITSGSRGWAEHYAEQGSAFIRIGNLTRDHIDLDLSDLQYVDVPEGSEGERTRVQLDDVLISITAYLGSVAVAPSDLNEAYVSQHVALVRPLKRKLLPRWIAYTVLSTVGKNHFSVQGYGGTKIQLSLEDVRTVPMLTPPITEQRTIVAYLDNATAKIDTLIAKVQLAIDLQKEHRTTLISAAVTGKIDVRGMIENRQQEAA